MRIGFYAPLKSPGHPKPSGDRNIGRLLIKALKASGHNVVIISELRSWDGKGSAKAQEYIRQQAKQEVVRCLKNDNNPPLDLIFTYHVYYKAPDWIGVEIAEKLNIPYVIAEASNAPKQDGGAWDCGHQQTLKCIKQATLIIALNPVDIECLAPLVKANQTISLLKPFLDETAQNANHLTARDELANRYQLDSKKTWLITVAMMRRGDKFQSYEQLAGILKQLKSNSWEHIVIGDGEAYEQIVKQFNEALLPSRFLNQLTPKTIYQWLAVSDVFVWPAVNEAFGLALLEAQSCGLPAVVQNYGGVSMIVEHQVTGYVIEPGKYLEFSAVLVDLIENPDLRKQMARRSKQKFLKDHSFDAAANQLDKMLKQLQ